GVRDRAACYRSTVRRGARHEAGRARRSIGLAAGTVPQGTGGPPGRFRQVAADVCEVVALSERRNRPAALLHCCDCESSTPLLCRGVRCATRKRHRGFAQHTTQDLRPYVMMITEYRSQELD